ncbi:MAG: hypothetical protein MZW92_07555 [Comamonadaceae bacterium]|nr:hypothetical protein [Comamonadaceae bacterium]
MVISIMPAVVEHIRHRRSQVSASTGVSMSAAGRRRGGRRAEIGLTNPRAANGDGC